MFVIYIYLKEIFLRIFFLLLGLFIIYCIFTEFINEILYFFIEPYFCFTNSDSLVINNFINFFLIEHKFILLCVFLNLVCLGGIHFFFFIIVLFSKQTIFYYFYYFIWIILILLLVNYLIYYFLVNIYTSILQNLFESNYFFINFEVTFFNYLEEILNIIFFYFLNLNLFFLFLILLKNNIRITYYIYGVIRGISIAYFIILIDNFLYLVAFILLVEFTIFLQYLSEYTYIYSIFFNNNVKNLCK